MTMTNDPAADLEAALQKLCVKLFEAQDNRQATQIEREIRRLHDQLKRRTPQSVQ